MHSEWSNRTILVNKRILVARVKLHLTLSVLGPALWPQLCIPKSRSASEFMVAFSSLPTHKSQGDWSVQTLQASLLSHWLFVWRINLCSSKRLLIWVRWLKALDKEAAKSIHLCASDYGRGCINLFSSNDFLCFSHSSVFAALRLSIRLRGKIHSFLGRHERAAMQSALEGRKKNGLTVQLGVPP